jgi:hypothetical protein
MNAKFEWFGFSVPRRHVYFYTVLIVASLFANTMKESLLGGRMLDTTATDQLTQLREQFNDSTDPFAPVP